MATDYWKAGDDVHKLATQVLLGMMEKRAEIGLLDPDEIIVVMRDGEMPPKWGLIPGKIKKVTKDLPLLTDKKYNYKYWLEIVGSTWNSMTDHQRSALLYHLFCHVDITENENSGETSYKLKGPPIEAFPEELEKYGYWWPSEHKDDIVKVLEELKE